MYLILDNHDDVVVITPSITYARMQANGTAIATDVKSATTVYASATDSFYAISTTYPGEQLFHVAEVADVPAGVVPGLWAYRGGKFVPASVASQVSVLKRRLGETDYKIIKCSECSLLGTPMPYDVAALHKERQVIRDEINKAQASDAK